MSSQTATTATTTGPSTKLTTLQKLGRFFGIGTSDGKGKGKEKEKPKSKKKGSRKNGIKSFNDLEDELPPVFPKSRTHHRRASVQRRRRDSTYRVVNSADPSKFSEETIRPDYLKNTSSSSPSLIPPVERTLHHSNSASRIRPSTLRRPAELSDTKDYKVVIPDVESNSSQVYGRGGDFESGSSRSDNSTTPSLSSKSKKPRWISGDRPITADSVTAIHSRKGSFESDSSVRVANVHPRGRDPVNSKSTDVATSDNDRFQPDPKGYTTAKVDNNLNRVLGSCPENPDEETDAGYETGASGAQSMSGGSCSPSTSENAPSAILSSDWIASRERANSTTIASRLHRATHIRSRSGTSSPISSSSSLRHRYIGDATDSISENLNDIGDEPSTSTHSPSSPLSPLQARILNTKGSGRDLWNPIKSNSSPKAVNFAASTSCIPSIPRTSANGDSSSGADTNEGKSKNQSSTRDRPRSVSYAPAMLSSRLKWGNGRNDDQSESRSNPASSNSRNRRDSGQQRPFANLAPMGRSGSDGENNNNSMAYRKKTSSEWTGEWNEDNMQLVIQKLRNLR